MEGGWKTCRETLRVVMGDGKGTLYIGRNWAILSLVDPNTGICFSRLGVGRKVDNLVCCEMQKSGDQMIYKCGRIF
jgi:hypothetical protein